VATSQRTEFFCGYTPAVSPTALKSMRATIRSLHIPRQTSGPLAEIAQQINPLLRGWIGYYGRFSRSALFSLVDYVNQKLKAWIMRKYKRFRFHKTRASLFLRKLGACPFSRFGRLPEKILRQSWPFSVGFFMEAIRPNANEKSILRDLAIYDYSDRLLARDNAELF